MTDPSDYPYVVAWGRMLGSYDSYIREQVNRAREDQAPTNATYRREDGGWATTGDITSTATRRQLGLEPLVPREPDLDVIAPELRNAILWTELFRDLFGLTAVEITDPQTLAVRFSTGWSIRLALELVSPQG